DLVVIRERSRHGQELAIRRVRRNTSSEGLCATCTALAPPLPAARERVGVRGRAKPSRTPRALRLAETPPHPDPLRRSRIYPTSAHQQCRNRASPISVHAGRGSATALPYRFTSTDTKNPSVSVRRGVICTPSPVISTAWRKISARSP